MSTRSPSIVRRLVLVTITAGLVTGAVGVLVVQAIERRNALADAEERNRSAAERTATVLDSRVEALGSELAMVASRRAIIGVTDETDDHLAAALRVSETLDQLVLYDVDGRPVAAAAVSRLLRADGAERFEAEITEQARPARIVANRDRSSIEVAVPVEDPPGTRAGWLVGRAPIALLTGSLTGQVSQGGVSGQETALAVVAADGSIVAHREHDRVVGGEVLALEELFSDGDDSARFLRDGEQVLASLARLQSVDGTVVVEQVASNALAPVQAIAGALTAVFLAVIVSIVIVVIAAGRRLLRPLGPLADAVERVAAGERGVRVALAGAGEVGVVTGGFNRMASSLEQREDELRRAEAATRRSEERLRLMVEGVQDYAIILLDPDASVRTWNTGARRLLGFSAAEALGRPLADVFDPEDPPPDPLVAAEDGPKGVEGWCRRADGSRLWAAIAATRLVDDDGAHYGYAVILHDLTERMTAREATEAALHREQQAANELRRANELKDEFLSMAAHEIRTPLSVILGASRLLGRNAEDLAEDDAARVRAMIETHADDMRTIVDRLLDFTRLQAGRVHLDPEPLDLRRELDEHLRSLERHLADHDVVLTAGRVPVVLDRAALRHIVTNLVSNAAKFSPAGTSITIAAGTEGGDVVIAITDEGVGVAAEDQERIFELFRQAPRQVITARGTGVGLAIVKRYVDLLDGSIAVESTLAQGSTFTVRLPCTLTTSVPTAT